MRRERRIATSHIIMAALLFFVISTPVLSEEALEETSYHWFFTRSKHINQLLQAGDIKKASAVWNKEATYFKESQKDADKKCTQDLADNLEKFYSQQARGISSNILSINSPETSENWFVVKRTIAEADSFLKEVAGHQVLEYCGRVARVTEEVTAAKDQLLSKIGSDMPDSFMAYQPGSGRDFFSEYPLEISPQEFLRGNKSLWMNGLSNDTCEKIKTFADCYGKSLSQQDLMEIGGLHFKKLLNQTGKATFQQMFAASLKTKDAGLPLEPIKDARIRVVQITSPSRLKDGSIDFPIELNTDAPFRTEKDELDAAFDSPTSGNADILVLLDTAMARVDRKINEPNVVTSKYQSSLITVPNPDYPVAEATLRQTQLNLQSVRQQASLNAATCQGLLCIVVAIANRRAINDAESNVQQAFNNLQTTPMTLEKPVYTPYQFNKTTLEASKVGTVNYYIIDRIAQSYVRGSFDMREVKSFTVCYGLREEDPDKFAYRSSTNKEDDVVTFEQSEVIVPLSKILDQIGQQAAKPIPPLSNLRNEILTDRNRYLASLKAKSYKTVTQQDPRFDSVVVVFNPNGPMASGFFVKDDIVVTNYHVVKEAKFVEMKLRDGSETFGKVIGQDVRLDLALIKVQARGVPVKLYQEQSLPSGGSVEAIGHPKGFEFSITRGIVSGIREIPSEFAPRGRKVRFIQTDAAINSGNSGGPLFLQDRVVGVNTQKVAAVAVEGLNFAIHYGEIVEFLETNGISLQK
jgi:serine protease Do